MKCPVCRATYRITESLVGRASQDENRTKPCHRCGADLAPLIELQDRAIAHHRQAIAQFTAGDLQTAIAENNRAIALNSQNSVFHAFAGQLFALAGMFDQAIRSWQIAQKLDPKNTFATTCLQILDRANPS